MKNSIRLIVIGYLLIAYMSSCKPEKNPGNDQAVSENAPNKELWAEQVESATNIKKTEGWSDEDWNSVNRNVDYKRIFDEITKAVLDGKQQAYDYINDSSLTIDQVKSILSRVDTAFVEDINTGKITEANPIKVDVTAEHISQIRVREKWYFDSEKFKLQKQSNAIALFKTSYLEDGSVKGYMPLFYVKLNN